MNALKTIIDVRTPMEYLLGHVQGSINIPLNEISNRIEEIKSMAHPVVLCCASGSRSGHATSILKSQGIPCENGGSWMSLTF